MSHTTRRSFQTTRVVDRGKWHRTYDNHVARRVKDPLPLLSQSLRSEGGSYHPTQSAEAASALLRARWSPQTSGLGKEGEGEKEMR